MMFAVVLWCTGSGSRSNWQRCH